MEIERKIDGGGFRSAKMPINSTATLRPQICFRSQAKPNQRAGVAPWRGTRGR
jgi:hypothetical protein